MVKKLRNKKTAVKTAWGRASFAHKYGEGMTIEGMRKHLKRNIP